MDTTVILDSFCADIIRIFTKAIRKICIFEICSYNSLA